MRTQYYFILNLLITFLFTPSLSAQNQILLNSGEQGISQKFNNYSETDIKALDSIITMYSDLGQDELYPVRKKEFKYDVNGRKISEIPYDWDLEIQQWVTEQKEEFFYNDNNLLSEIIDYWKEESEQEWHRSGKHEYIYENGNLIQLIYYNWWPDKSLWVLSKKDEYQYDTNNNLIRFINYYYNQESLLWEPQNKIEYDYDGNNYMTEMREYLMVPQNSDWLITSKTVYSYDNNGDLTEETKSTYFSDLSEWRDYSKRCYLYNANHNIISDTVFLWNQNAGQWNYKSYGINTYDVSNIKTGEEEYDWDATLWIGDFKENYIIDSNGEISELDYYDWDTDSNQWSFNEKIILNIDATYTTDQLILPFEYYLYNYSIHHMLLSLDSYINDGNENWFSVNNVSYYYSNYNANSIDEPVNNLVTMYPNPIRDQVFIKSKGLSNNIVFELYNLQGILVLYRTLSNNTSVCVSSLPNGLYFYSIQQNGKTQKGKLIIKR
jgi:hypothetical protein